MKITKTLTALIFFLGISFSFVAPASILAATNLPETGAVTSPEKGAVNQPDTSIALPDPLGFENFCDLVKSLLNIVLAIGLPIAVFFLVWSGFKFILARGSQTGLADAKRNFQYVIIGIAVFLGAWTFATIISATIQSLDKSNNIHFCGR
jgi:hypothetical protein